MRTTLAVIGGFIVWGLTAILLNYGLRIMLPGYHAAEPQMQFTLGMMLARLALPGAIPSLAAGFVCAWIAPLSRRAVIVLVGLMLAFFLPTHYNLWDKFPIWYHITFIASLVVLIWCGAKLRQSTQNSIPLRNA